jgi:hypothetical protein
MRDPKELLLDHLKLRFEKNQKKFQKAFDKTKKYAILNLCHASVAVVSKNDGAEKKFEKKIKLRLTKQKSMLY